MGEMAATVHIIEDDASLRQALDSLFRSTGLATRQYGSVTEFRRAAVARGRLSRA
jgi:FixJ family two-component response regulator